MNPIQATAVARLVQFRVSNVDELRKQIRGMIHSERRRLERSAQEEGDDELLEGIQDDLAVLDEMVETADQLTFVGLYRVVELRLKALLNRFVANPEDLEKVFKFKQLTNLLKNQFSIDIADLQGFKAINEIRLINNSVKHDGKVGRELADTFGHWRKGDPLNGLEPAFKRLSPRVFFFFKDLAKKLP